MPKSPLDLSFFHPTNALLDAFTRLADPERCGQRLTVENLHDDEDPSFGLRVATFSAMTFEEEDRPRPQVLLNFGAHGRELVSSEVALRLASMLCGEAPSRFVEGDTEKSRLRIAELLRQVVVKVVPVQVPSARRLAETGSGSCKQRRLNSRGVDVNRNWDVAWTAGDDEAGSSQYRGPRPFSEPETRVLGRLAADWRPDVFVDVRSGDRYMAIPYAHRAAGPTNRADRAAMLDGLRSVTSMFARTHPRMGNVPSGPAASMGEEPYRATGTALDYMYVKAGVRRCYMLEVYGASTVYGVGNRKDRGIGRVPSSASVVNLLQLSSSNSSSSSLRRSNMTTNVTALASRRPVLELKQWRKRAGGGGSLLPTPEEEAHVAAVDKMEGEAEALQMRRRVSEQQRTLRTPIFLSIKEGLHPASPEEVQAAAMLQREELAEMKYQSSRSPPPPALEAVQRLHGMPHPAEAAITFPHGRSDSVVNDVRVGGSSRTVHHPRRARGNWPEQTDLRIKRPHLREADDPSGIPRQSFIAIEQREGATGLDRRLEASDERLFDCVAFFNPTSFGEFESTVNAWADALLVLINSSLTSVEEAGRHK